MAGESPTSILIISKGKSVNLVITVSSAVPGGKVKVGICAGGGLVFCSASCNCLAGPDMVLGSGLGKLSAALTVRSTTMSTNIIVANFFVFIFYLATLKSTLPEIDFL